MTSEFKYGTMLEVAQECASQLGRIADALPGAQDPRIDSLDERLEETLKLFAEKDRKQRAVNVALRSLLCGMFAPAMNDQALMLVLRDELIRTLTETISP